MTDEKIKNTYLKHNNINYSSITLFFAFSLRSKQVSHIHSYCSLSDLTNDLTNFSVHKING